MLEVCFVYMENSYKTSVWLDQSWQQQKNNNKVLEYYLDETTLRIPPPPLL